MINNCNHQKNIYLEGLRKFKRKGIQILFDGVERPEREWISLFKNSEDGGFYRCAHTKGEDGCLREIRFDWVYNQVSA